jgi:hypothetical protein
MQIHAVTDTKEFDIAAAAQKLQPDARRLMTQADVAVGAKRITVAEIDAKLAASRLTTMERLQLKISLERCGLLA